PGDLPITSMDEKRVAVGWDTRTWSRFHHIWLRDHCRCSICLHPKTMQRLLNTFEIPPDITPVKVESSLEGLRVVWPVHEYVESGEHESLYSWEWLKRNSYDPRIVKEETAEHFSRRKKILWNVRIERSPPTISYNDVMKPGEEGKRALFRWLTNIETFGFSFITDVPPDAISTESLVRKISFIRETHYGGFWEFTSDLAKGDTAYTNIALGAHTDNTYFPPQRTISTTSITTNSTLGGQTLLVDGFYVASILRSLHPSAYHLLSSIHIPAHAAGERDSAGIFSTGDGFPVLSHNSMGDLIQVRWNNDDRSPLSSISPSVMEEFYSALRTFHSLLTTPDSEYLVQLRPGTAVIVDNHRVLHGRTAFTGKRRMCGAYIGKDEWRAKLKGLREKYG
ncbi:hypothetical protein J3R30DRAFT_3216830, partial [Lentinula aciculospora]